MTTSHGQPKPVRKVSLALAVTALLLLTVSQGSAQQKQETVYVRGPRPISDAITELGKRYGWVISYEDPQYEYAGDIEDATQRVRKDIKPGEQVEDSKRVILPRVKELSVTFAQPSTPNDINAELQVTKSLVDAYERKDGTTFEVRRTPNRVEIVPAMFRRASGELQPARPLLDTLIRISPDDRNGATFLGALCEELQGQTGVKVFAGMFPQNAFAQYHTKAGYENISARQVLTEFLDGMPHGDRYTWALFFEPHYGYALNIRAVKEPTKPVEAAPKMNSGPQRIIRETTSPLGTTVDVIR
jgi:hypothetical protein